MEGAFLDTAAVRRIGTNIYETKLKCEGRRKWEKTKKRERKEKHGGQWILIHKDNNHLGKPIYSLWFLLEVRVYHDLWIWRFIVTRKYNKYKRAYVRVVRVCIAWVI